MLITGVGMVATAARVSQVLAAAAGSQYDLALNLGVCGAFDRALAPGTVVHVVADSMPELGAEDHDRFLTLGELGLLGEDEFPYTGGRVVNTKPPANAVLRRLPAVTAITVNTVHGSEASIARVTRHDAPQVESMEGAAFMYSCLIGALPFAQVRSVSNAVEPRDRNAWKMGDAIQSLGATALEIFDTL